MTSSRLLITGKNGDLPDDAAQSSLWPYRWCPTCEGEGNLWVYPIDPGARGWTETCPECNGERLVDIKPASRAQSSHTRGNVARPVTPLPAGRAAHIYDATNNRWISHPSRMSRDAVAAAEQRHKPANLNTRLSVPTLNPAPGGAHTAAGRILHDVLEALLVIAGLAVFAFIAGFFLVL